MNKVGEDMNHELDEAINQKIINGPAVSLFVCVMLTHWMLRDCNAFIISDVGSPLLSSHL